MNVICPNYEAEIATAKEFQKEYPCTYHVSLHAQFAKDQAAILWLVHHFNVTSLCEIGTWEGYTSLFMWRNANIKRQKAIDICSNFVGGGDGWHHDLDVYGKYFLGVTPIVLEKADTTRYVPKPEDHYDMVFIDGNHDYSYVKNDTKLAVKMEPQIVAFHDWQNGNPGVDKFLTELCGRTDVQNVYGSAVCFLEVTPADIAVITSL